MALARRVIAVLRTGLYRKPIGLCLLADANQGQSGLEMNWNQSLLLTIVQRRNRFDPGQCSTLLHQFVTRRLNAGTI